MEDMDTIDSSTDIPDEEMLIMQEVVKGEADLFYLHCYLSEIFRKG